ncbi:MAG: hypothetical protein HY719_02625 [Planctomycetes bacterium]|nr:hypothetical protein [Planctomycetota bacterium]
MGVAHVSVSELVPGMVVAVAVEDSQGRILLRAGETIQEEFIPLLKRRGIRAVQIVAEDEGRLAPEGEHGVIRLTSDEIDEIDRRLEDMFAPHEDRRDYMVIKKIARKYVLELSAWRNAQ